MNITMKKNKTKVFIADDDQGILDATTLILEYEGYDVATASNGETISRVKQHKPDVVLLDIWLSGVNGGDIARELKSDKETQAIPVIMFSANRDIEKIASAVSAEGFLIKPFNLTDLLSEINKHVKDKGN